MECFEFHHHELHQVVDCTGSDLLVTLLGGQDVTCCGCVSAQFTSQLGRLWTLTANLAVVLSMVERLSVWAKQLMKESLGHMQFLFTFTFVTNLLVHDNSVVHPLPASFPRPLPRPSILPLQSTA